MTDNHFGYILKIGTTTYLIINPKYMPQQDKTGPNGKGPKTGCGLGDCSDKKESDESRGKVGFGQKGSGRQGRGFWKRLCSRRNSNS